jgi:hypothetical protein
MSIWVLHEYAGGGIEMNFFWVQSKEADRWLTLKHIRVQEVDQFVACALPINGRD